jgi:hypothetical protein
MQGGFSYDVSPAKKGADPSVRPGDLTPRKLHYQTGPATAVNGCESRKCATIYRDRLAPHPLRAGRKASQLSDDGIRWQMLQAYETGRSMVSFAAIHCGHPALSYARHEPISV